MLPSTAENNEPIHIAGAAAASSRTAEGPRRFSGLRLPLACAKTMRSSGVTTRVIEASSPIASSANVLLVRIIPPLLQGTSVSPRLTPKFVFNLVETVDVG
jgi:hypothetical protein